MRNAAGQLIENVNKAVRRNKEVTSDSIPDFYEEVISLYRLDQISSASGKITIGPLPEASKALIGALAVCWLGMGIYLLSGWIKKKKTVNSSVKY